MTDWHQVATAAPDLAAAVRTQFEAHLHHVVGTLTADGSPRLSGTEARFHDGKLWLGCMPSSVKARDLRRDPRFALHSAPLDVEMMTGDAKVSGTVTEVTDLVMLKEFLAAIGHGGDLEPGAATAFTCNIEAATLTKVAGDHLEVTTWSTKGGLVVRHVS